MQLRVVLAMASAKQRTLTRLGLEMSGSFAVVGTAVDELDVEFIVGSLRPDLVVVDFPDAHDGALAVTAAVREACDAATPVLYSALVARHHAETGEARSPRPVEVARLLRETVFEHAVVSV